MTQEIAKFPNYEVVIGIEIHVQLKTNSKIFCSCPNQFGQKPNTNICPVCAGHPGVLPALNKKVVDYAIMAGLATHCTIAKESNLARKHYTYPDIPKNYQITQDKKPICQEGYISIDCPDGNKKNIRLLRIHMEEDSGKSIHSTSGKSLIDLNRAGTPLLEIVTYPDMRNKQEAKDYLTKIRNTVRYLGISEANMEEGSFRADINISIRKKGAEKLGTKVELKNINSFKFIVNAIDYEIERQVELVENGEQIKQETRTWNNKKQKTFFMRSKEENQDYRYFQEPDLPTIRVDEAWLEHIKKKIPELPQEKHNRLQKNWGLSTYESEILIDHPEIAKLFEESAQKSQLPKQTANWILRNLLAHLKEYKLHLNETKITAQAIAELVIALDKKVINSKVAQDIFLEMVKTGQGADTIIKQKDLGQIDSVTQLEKIALKIIQDNPDNVEKYKSGNDRVFKFFVGQAMKETKGRGNPKVIQELFKKHLG